MKETRYSVILENVYRYSLEVRNFDDLSEALKFIKKESLNDTYAFIILRDNSIKMHRFTETEMEISTDESK